MRRLVQDLKTGKVTFAETPIPQVSNNSVVIKTALSAISPGTERMLLEFGKSGWIQKAKKHPDKVKQVLQKFKTDGLVPTMQAVFAKLGEPIPLGYSNCGEIVEVGKNVTDFTVGDRVVSNGAHAEIVTVPSNLCAKIPDSVSYESACFTVLSSIALQGIRLATPTIGETCVVLGLGPIGLITCQLLRANGCRVIAFDFEVSRVKLASELGARGILLDQHTNPILACMELTNSKGVDSVFITAATNSNAPAEQAPKMCRKRGKIILVGVSGLNFNRADFYEKELSFQVSCSYGPGRYEDAYENESLDYPVGFVRWTAQRNFAAALELMEQSLLKVDWLITKSISFENLVEEYDTVLSDRSQLGILIKYPKSISLSKRITLHTTKVQDIDPKKDAVLGLIGAGLYARAVVIPNVTAAGGKIQAIASKTGASAADLMNKYSIPYSTSDYNEILEDSKINAVIISTHNNTHTDIACAALQAGKHVFVEKPLGLTIDDLQKLYKVHNEFNNQLLMVGFNRRFSPLVLKIKDLLKNRSTSLCSQITVNAGLLPKDHWCTKREIGGGRILGEACHFIDLLAAIVSAPIQSVYTSMLRNSCDGISSDKASIHLNFADGSIGTVHYFSNGHKSLPKERLEIFHSGRVIQLDSFQKLNAYGFDKIRKLKLRKPDKGHKAEFQALLDVIRTGGNAPIPMEAIWNSSLATLAAEESARLGEPINLSNIEKILQNQENESERSLKQSLLQSQF